MSEPTLELPLLPLRDTVVLPTMMAPLIIGRRKSIDAVERAMQGDGRVFLSAQRNGHLINPEKDDLFLHGCIAEITDKVQLPDKSIKVMVEGRQRGVVEEFLLTEPGFVCRVRPVVDSEADAAEAVRLFPATMEKFAALMRLNRKLPPDALKAFEEIDDPSRKLDMMIPVLTLRFQDRQDLLELAGVVERVARVTELIQKETAALQADREGRQKARAAGQAQHARGAAREQAGDPEADEFKNELAELDERLGKKRMPEYARERARRELKKLRLMSPMSAEATVVRNYLDWILALPWDEVTKDKLDLAEAERILNQDHYGLGKIKERILEYLAVQQLAGNLKGPILCFVGPPGVGKTSLARSIARATGRNYVRLSLGGIRDEAEVRGHRRTYIGAFPGKIIQSLRRAGSSNPVLLLDEVDKLAADFRGDPAAALLEVLDPEQNNSFQDHYLDLDYDLSHVMFITTANHAHGIPAPLMDRMEVIQLSGYTEFEKIQIARQFLVPRQRQEHGLEQVDVQVADKAIRAVINGYTREAGVRSLEREVASIMRKIARDVVAAGSAGQGGAGQKPRAFRVNTAAVRRYLGEPQHRERQAEEKDEVGAASGLAVTAAGGDILVIEVTVMPGSGKLTITGKLGDVMQESAQAAMSYIRSRAGALGLDRSFYQKVDLHIHVPEGAIPKDGPSAGITMATALASALTRVPVRRDVAMTGEITLRGKVLPIGGVKEKLLAAARSGYTRVIVPRENQKDLKDLPLPVKNALEIIPAASMDEVLGNALVRNGKPLYPNGLHEDPLDAELHGS
jgi:ATP-dependent Lon protease